MTEIERLLERQSRWQASRRDLTWPEKIRMVEAVRDSVVALRRSREDGAGRRADSE